MHVLSRTWHFLENAQLKDIVHLTWNVDKTVQHGEPSQVRGTRRIPAVSCLIDLRTERVVANNTWCSGTTVRVGRPSASGLGKTSNDGNDYRIASEVLLELAHSHVLRRLHIMASCGVHCPH